MRALAARGVIFPVLLARLTTYSDARTLADPIDTWISSTWRTATWGAEREFWPLLVSGMPQVDRIGHVPIPELTLGGLGGALRRQCTIILRGWDTELGAVAPYLTQSGARDLLGMRVEIGELLLEAPSEALDWQRIGAEAAGVPLFVGRVEAVLRLGQEIELRLEVELPAMPWLTANDPTTNDPDDLGRVLPLPPGRGGRRQEGGGGGVRWRDGAAADRCLWLPLCRRRDPGRRRGRALLGQDGEPADGSHGPGKDPQAGRHGHRAHRRGCGLRARQLSTLRGRCAIRALRLVGRAAARHDALCRPALRSDRDLRQAARDCPLRARGPRCADRSTARGRGAAAADALHGRGRARFAATRDRYRLRQHAVDRLGFALLRRG